MLLAGVGEGPLREGSSLVPMVLDGGSTCAWIHGKQVQSIAVESLVLFHYEKTPLNPQGLPAGAGHGLLREGGSLVLKVLEGGGTAALAARLRQHFANVAWVTPSATRKESREVFLVCLKRRPLSRARVAGRAAGAA